MESIALIGFMVGGITHPGQFQKKHLFPESFKTRYTILMNRTELCDQIALEFHHLPIAETECAEDETPLMQHVNGNLSITYDVRSCLPVPEDEDVDELCRLALMNIDPEFVEDTANA